MKKPFAALLLLTSLTFTGGALPGHMPGIRSHLSCRFW